VSEPGGPAGPPRAVHQFVPALIPRDATGTHTLLLREALRSAGWRSEIFAEATHDELAGESFKVERYPDHAQADDVLVYQFSTSSMLADFLLGRPEELVIDYHNITRPELYEPWEPDTARRSADALDQLSRLAPRAALGLADSSFNEADLVAAGCPRTAVVPVLVDVDRVAARPDPRVADRLRSAKADGGADWLFVGRVVPSKAQHELVKALWAYRRLYDPAARLHLVGSMPSNRYLRALRAFVDDLGLRQAVHLTGEVTESALAAHFEAADVYVSLSVHEGFGVPLLESMRAGVPVVARRTGAVPATVADAGLVLDRTEPSYVAGAVHRVLTDAGLRRRLAGAGHVRVAEHSLERCGALAVTALSAVAGAPPGAGR
jgi:glycosyltransferase involved in cell wall biosynthesis